MTYTLLHGQFVIRYPDLPRQGPERTVTPSGVPDLITGDGIREHGVRLAAAAAGRRLAEPVGQPGRVGKID